MMIIFLPSCNKEKKFSLCNEEKERYCHLPRRDDLNKQNPKKTEQRRRSTRVSDMMVRESYRVSFHMLINSWVTTGKLIPQSLSSFNEDNYERHKCKHLIVVYTSARACKISLLNKNIVLIHFRHYISLFP